MCPRRAMASKKSSATYTAAPAALGGRPLKAGQSRWFVGYKKHTMRLWLPTVHPAVTLVPLIRWITPANVAEGGVLLPSLRWCRQALGGGPGIVGAGIGLSVGARQARRPRRLADGRGHQTSCRHETGVARCGRADRGLSARATTG